MHHHRVVSRVGLLDLFEDDTSVALTSNESPVDMGSNRPISAALVVPLNVAQCVSRTQGVLPGQSDCVSTTGVHCGAVWWRRGRPLGTLTVW